MEELKRPFAWIVVACASIGAAHAAALAWLSDDAFISFRYARNLVEGAGLVFNVGERVEGITNPAWTVFVALGLRLGASAETWSTVWGIAFFAASIALLGLAHARMRARFGIATMTLPLAAIAGAVHREWATFATSGLETSAFTFFALAGLVAIVEPSSRPIRRAAIAGVLFAMAALTRPDGAIFAALGACVFLREGRRGIARAATLAIAFVIVWGPFTAWRISYYGSFFPNTYFAKSAGLAWWSQGLFYVRLYVERYWPLAFAPIALFVAPSARYAAPALAFAFAYGAYVARVGGDFMFGRLLVPITPMLLLALDAAALRLAIDRPRVASIVTAVVAIAIVATPSVVGADPIRGVVDERAYYTQEYVADTNRRADVVRPVFAGLPVIVAIYGDEARFAYVGRVPVAIEAQAGLTDAFTAHQPLAARGRVGHEKPSPLDYLIEKRRAHMTFSLVPEELLALDDYIPTVFIDFVDVRARLLRWDPDLMATLRSRGARVIDFPAMLDALIANLARMPDDAVVRELARCRHFYFDHVRDPDREAAFAKRLDPR